jgi:hypothetical protein
VSGPAPGPWAVQELETSHHGYAGWHTYAVRSSQNVCLAVVGEVDRFEEERIEANANEIADYLDITADSSLDRNYDGVLDSCQCAEHPEVCCNADLTANGVVDGADLGALLAFWGPKNPVFPRADINADGNVDGADLGVLLASWGLCSH